MKRYRALGAALLLALLALCWSMLHQNPIIVLKREGGTPEARRGAEILAAIRATEARGLFSDQTSTSTVVSYSERGGGSQVTFSRHLSDEMSRYNETPDSLLCTVVFDAKGGDAPSGGKNDLAHAVWTGWRSLIEPAPLSSNAHEDIHKDVQYAVDVGRDEKGYIMTIWDWPARPGGHTIIHVSPDFRVTGITPGA